MGVGIEPTIPDMLVKMLACRVVWFHNSKHLLVNASVSREIWTRGMLEKDIVNRKSDGKCCKRHFQRLLV